MKRAFKIVALVCVASGTGVGLGLQATHLLAAKKKPRAFAASSRGQTFLKAETPEQFDNSAMTRRGNDEWEDHHAHYFGTMVQPNPGAKASSLRLQKVIAEEMSRRDIVPPHRAHYFQNYLNIPKVDMRCNGWYCTILDVTPGENGPLVKLRVTPQLSSRMGNITTITDYLDETYSMGPDGPELVGVVEPEGVIKGICLD